MKYNYVLKRSAKRRRISVSISMDNTITVHCSMRMPISGVEKFLSDKSSWIDKHLAANDRRNLANIDYLEYRKILINGVPFQLKIGDKNSIEQNCVTVKDIDCIKPLFIKTFSESFLNEVNAVCKQTKLKANNISIKGYKSRWGCCDGKDNIIFNYKVFMLPENLRRYVIIHELCHTLHHDHSKYFWAAVKRFLPDYKNYSKQLKVYSFINNIYR
jgi:hypothetical protein